jgi:hypothetical protein
VIEEPYLFLVEPMQNALSSYKSVSFEDIKHQFVATCLAWADCRSLRDLITHISLSSGTSLLVPVEEENKQK